MYLLTCVYPQVDLEVVGGAEGLSAVGAVLGGRALAALTVLGQRQRNASCHFAARILPDICQERETKGRCFKRCFKIGNAPEPYTHKRTGGNTPVYFFLVLYFPSTCLFLSPFFFSCIVFLLTVFRLKTGFTVPPWQNADGSHAFLQA